MNEQIPHGTFEARSVGKEGLMSTQDRSYLSVVESLRESLNVLKEAYDAYPEVTFPNGEVRTPETRQEEAVGEVQRLLEAIDGLIEKNAGTGGAEEVHVERALRLTKGGVEHLAGFLAVQADLANMARNRGNQGAGELGKVLETVAQTLLTSGEVGRVEGAASA